MATGKGRRSGVPCARNVDSRHEYSPKIIRLAITKPDVSISRDFHFGPESISVHRIASGQSFSLRLSRPQACAQNGSSSRPKHFAAKTPIADLWQDRKRPDITEYR